MTYGIQNPEAIRKDLLQAYTDGAADIAKRRKPPKELPGRLKSLRQKLNLSQIEFSEAFGLAFSNVKNWEQPNRSKPSGIAALYLKLIERDPDTIQHLIKEIRKEELEDCTD